MSDQDLAEPVRRGRTLGIAVFLLGLLAVAVLMAWHLWQDLQESSISQHGLIALGLGAGVTFLLGVLLMSLVFISSRRGFDDEAGKD